jgi:hypothetical protein
MKTYIHPLPVRTCHHFTGSETTSCETLRVFAPSPELARKNICRDGEGYTFTHSETLPYNKVEKVSQVAAELGDNWQVVPLSTEYEDTNWYLLRSDGLRLFLANGPTWSKAGKAEISLSTPRHKGSYIEPRDAEGKRVSTPKIGVSWDAKTPEQIAKDITRRLLPDCEIVHHATLSQIAKMEQADSDQLASLTALCEALGCPVPRDYHSKYPRFSGSHEGVDFTVNYSGSITLKMDYLPKVKALKICEAIKGII